MAEGSTTPYPPTRGMKRGEESTEIRSESGKFVETLLKMPSTNASPVTGEGGNKKIYFKAKIHR